MWTEETMNDIYDAGVTDDRFALMSLMNERCQVKVKTPVGDTDRFTLNRIEMQGTVAAPLNVHCRWILLGDTVNHTVQDCTNTEIPVLWLH